MVVDHHDEIIKDYNGNRFVLMFIMVVIVVLKQLARPLLGYLGSQLAQTF